MVPLRMEKNASCFTLTMKPAIIRKGSINFRKLMALLRYISSCVLLFVTATHDPTSHQLETLQVKAREYFSHGLATSTQRAYSACQHQYLAFCFPLNLPLFPANEQTLMIFVTELASRIQLQSIPVYLSAIRAHTIANGYPNPLDETLQLHQTIRASNKQSARDNNKTKAGP